MTTVGEESYKRLLMNDKQEVGDTSREMNKGFEEEIWKCIHAYQRKRQVSTLDPFYVVVLVKKERLMKNVMRRYYFARESEPTPDYDQIVYRFNPMDSELRFKWVVPDKDTVTAMTLNSHLYPRESQDLIQYCKDFVAGLLADYQKVIIL